MSDLMQMSDDQLAQWQAGWHPNSDKYIRAEKEWERRRINHEYGLQKELARSNQKWMIAAAIIGVAGTLLGAAGGAYMANYLQDRQLSQLLQPTAHAEN